MRLTEIVADSFDRKSMRTLAHYRPRQISTNEEILYKLGQLEDIEDELGIDLITLFKALKNGIWIKQQSQTKYPLALLRRHYSNGRTKYYVFDGKAKVIKLKDYGKTWALTKEELTNR